MLVVAVEVTEQVDAVQRVRLISEERRRALQRYQSLVRAGTQVVWVADAGGAIVEAGPGWEEMTGQAWEEARGFGWMNAVHPDDRDPVARAWALATGEVSPLFEHTYRIRTVDGAFRHLYVRAAPVLEDDSVVEWVGIANDIEEQWQERRRRDLLGRAAAATADAMRLDEMFSALARVIVPALADGCGVYLLPEPVERPVEGLLVAERVAGAARDGLPEVPPRREEHFSPDSAFASAVRRRSPVRSSFPPGVPPPGFAPTGSGRWLAEAEANSMIILPVVVDGAVAAVVAAAACGGRTPFNGDDVILLERMFDRVRVPLSHIMEFQRTQSVALALQRSLLSEPPDVPGLRIAARYRPSSAAAAEVGGTGTTPSCCTTARPRWSSGTWRGTTCPPPSPWASCATCCGDWPSTGRSPRGRSCGAWTSPWRPCTSTRAPRPASWRASKAPATAGGN